MDKQVIKSLERLTKMRKTLSTNSTTKQSSSPSQRQKRQVIRSQKKLSTTLRQKKKMSPRSAKAKGRKLQQWVVEKLLSLMTNLTNLDIKSTPMGVNGVDVQLSSQALEKFPYSIECKNTERTRTLYNYYRQACSYEELGEPIVIIKMNREKPLAIVDAEHFIKLGIKND